MKHVIHLLAWDVRRLRFILAVWIVVVTAYTANVGIRPFAVHDASLRESIAVVDSLMWVTMMLLMFALVSFVIHGHPTVGTDAFWMTRAIPAQSLLASKLLLIGAALLAIPLIAEGVLLAVNRMPASISAGVLAQAASIRLVVITLLVVAAALTRNLPRFALLCGAALLTIALAIGMSVAVMMRDVEERVPVNTSVRTVDDPSPLVVFNALFICAVIVMLLVQYRTRLKRRSVAVGAAGVAAALLVAWLWPVPFLRHRLVVPDWATRDGALTVRVDPATISTNTPYPEFLASRRSEWSTVNGLIHVDGTEPGWTADLGLREASLQLPNGVTLRSPGSWRTTVVLRGAYGTAREYAAIRDLLGVKVIGRHIPLQTGPPSRQYMPVLFVIRRAEVAPHLPARGHYRARMDVNLTQYVVDGAIPLRPGATHQNGGYRLIVDRTTVFDNEFAIVAREARATSMWERRPWAVHQFYLRNRARGEAVAVNDFTLRGGFTMLRFLPIGDFSIGSAQTSGFASRGMVLRFPPRYTPTAETLDVDEAWLAGAELVIVRRTEEGWVERTVEIPDFPIGQ